MELCTVRACSRNVKLVQQFSAGGGWESTVGAGLQGIQSVLLSHVKIIDFSQPLIASSISDQLKQLENEKKNHCHPLICSQLHFLSVFVF